MNEIKNQPKVELTDLEKVIDKILCQPSTVLYLFEAYTDRIVKIINKSTVYKSLPTIAGLMVTDVFGRKTLHLLRLETRHKDKKIRMLKNHALDKVKSSYYVAIQQYNNAIDKEDPNRKAMIKNKTVYTGCFLGEDELPFGIEDLIEKAVKEKELSHV
jgi:hypothetical protein